MLKEYTIYQYIKCKIYFTKPTKTHDTLKLDNNIIFQLYMTQNISVSVKKLFQMQFHPHLHLDNHHKKSKHKL